MEKSVIDIICEEYDSFFDSEKKIAGYIINHYDKVVEMTVSDLARESGASEASVSRFCRRIGMKGFHQLKISLARGMVENDSGKIKTVSNRISVEDYSQSLQNILANKTEEIRQTISNMDNEDLPKILEIIKNARLVQFTAAGNTIPVIIDGAYKFNQIGIHAITSEIWETQIASVFNLTKEDVIIAVSNSGESRNVITALEIAKEKGVPSIAITNSPLSGAARLADHHITTTTREKIFLDGYCFSRVSATTVIEVLYLFLTSMMKKNAYKTIARHENSISFSKS